MNPIFVFSYEELNSYSLVLQGGMADCCLEKVLEGWGTYQGGFVLLRGGNGRNPNPEVIFRKGNIACD